MIKRLVDAVVFGFGASAGKALFDEAAAKLEEQQREPTEDERLAAEVEAKKRAIKEAKQQAAARQKAEREREKANAKREADIDAELQALKKKLRP